MKEAPVSLLVGSQPADWPGAFISYHRADRQIVLQLAKALAAIRVTARGDWNLEASVEYENVLHEWIEITGMFVLIMTPESLNSSEVKKEIDCALRLRKKLAPVLLRQVALDAVPPEFRAINWVIIQDDSDLQLAANQLMEALEKDRDWEKSHTSFLHRAMDWERAGWRRSAALRREDLKEAEHWLTDSIRRWTER